MFHVKHLALFCYKNEGSRENNYCEVDNSVNRIRAVNRIHQKEQVML